MTFELSLEIEGIRMVHLQTFSASEHPRSTYFHCQDLIPGSLTRSPSLSRLSLSQLPLSLHHTALDTFSTSKCSIPKIFCLQCNQTGSYTSRLWSIEHYNSIKNVCLCQFFTGVIMVNLCPDFISTLPGSWLLHHLLWGTDMKLHHRWSSGFPRPMANNPDRSTRGWWWPWWVFLCSEWFQCTGIQILAGAWRRCLPCRVYRVGQDGHLPDPEMELVWCCCLRDGNCRSHPRCNLADRRQWGPWHLLIQEESKRSVKIHIFVQPQLLVLGASRFARISIKSTQWTT